MLVIWVMQSLLDEMGAENFLKEVKRLYPDAPSRVVLRTEERRDYYFDMEGEK